MSSHRGRPASHPTDAHGLVACPGLSFLPLWLRQTQEEVEKEECEPGCSLAGLLLDLDSCLPPGMLGEMLGPQGPDCLGAITGLTHI